MESNQVEELETIMNRLDEMSDDDFFTTRQKIMLEGAARRCDVVFEEAGDSIGVGHAGTSCLQRRVKLHERHLYDWLTEIEQKFRLEPTWRPDEINSPYGAHHCRYGNDDFEGGDGDYVTIGFNLPNGVFAEIEDGTSAHRPQYGNLQGLRIYLGTHEF